MDVEFDDELDIIAEECYGEIQPYMYEPVVSENNSQTTSDSEDSEVDNGELEDAINLSGTSPDEWCSCNNCVQMPTLLECVCCQQKMEMEIDEKLVDRELQCITDHEGFQGNCLNIDVLEVSFYEFLEREGHPMEGEEIHETYRYIAYRRFVRWIWKGLPKHYRKVLPSCVVGAIRSAFPSEEYSGFKYPRK